MTDWIEAAWGKFRGWQRTLAASEQLTADQMRAAWKVWDGMRKSSAAAVQGNEGWADKLHAHTVEMVAAMPLELHPGPNTFSRWLVENQATLAKALERSVAESSHTTDEVSAQLIR